MQTPEDRLKMVIGDMLFQNTFLASRIETLEAELNKLKAQQPDNVVKFDGAKQAE